MIMDIVTLLYATASVTVLILSFAGGDKPAAYLPKGIIGISVLGLGQLIALTGGFIARAKNLDIWFMSIYEKLNVLDSTTGTIIVCLIAGIILPAIQCFFMKKNITRITETAARFALNGYTPKLMVIEAEYNSGAITRYEKEEKESRLQEQLDCLGAFDVAVTCFIKASFAALVVTVLFPCAGSIINKINGFALDLNILKQSLIFSTYGSVSYFIPAFFTMLAINNNAVRMWKRLKKEKNKNSEEQNAVKSLDAITLEIGYGLIPLADKEQGAELLTGIRELRGKQFLPKVRIIDNTGLGQNEYRLLIYGEEAAKRTVPDESPVEAIIKTIAKCTANHDFTNTEQKG